MPMKIEFFPSPLMADCTNPKSIVGLLIEAATLIPTSQYLLGLVLFVLIFLYNFLEFHLFRDLLKGFRGDQVTLTFNPRSHIYEGVASKCRIFHGRYLATPWLSNPHFQTAFLNFFGRPPVFNYKRQVFQIPDGGTIALDWLMASDIGRGAFGYDISEDDLAPIVIVIPGLMSDSSSAYIKHLVFKIAKRGWNVVVSNHRGLGGISLTSDCFYNAGWTEDVRRVINYLHQEHPKSPLFAVGTSIGANILVKYLGENREETPIAGAASICSPWDLVVCDRFITRRLIQRFYDRALTIGLQGYAQIHQTVYSRLADWEGIKKSRSVRDFDNYATCLVAKFETVDTYYRHCSSASYVGNVAVPLLCISALDDPVCTKEAIPWDECRANRNIILATTRHGGHLGFFEGILGDRLWWVRAVDEFLGVLHSSPFMHGQKKDPRVCQLFLTESTIDKGPYLNMMDDGLVNAMCNEGTQIDKTEDTSEDLLTHDEKTEITTVVVESEEQKMEENPSCTNEAIPYLKFEQRNQIVNDVKDITAPVNKRMKQLLKQNKTSMWLLMYIAVITTWPLVGPALIIFFKRKLKNVLPPAWPRR